MGDLSSAPLAPVGPDDHVRGPQGAPLVVVYGDYECPFCAALELRLRELPGARRVPPLPRPRRPPARVRGRLRGRGRGPARAPSGRCTTRCSPTRAGSRTRTCGRAPSGSGLDLARFDADRRDDAVAARIRADFRGGVRAGVPTTPTLFHDGVRHAGRPDEAVLARLANLVA